MAGGVRWPNRQNLERIVDLDAAMPRLLGMITARRPGSFPFAKAMCSEGARCLLRGTAAVASMPQDFEQFPTTDGDIEEPSCGRPGPRAALSASQSASIGSLLRQARWCCVWSIKKGGRVILLAWPDFSNFTTAEVKRTISS